MRSSLNNWLDHAGRVLLVGPESPLRRSAATVLKMEGFRVFVADDLTVGTELLRSHQPEVTLVDIDGVPAWEVALAALRQVDPAIPFVLLVGDTNGSPQGEVVSTSEPTSDVLDRPVAHHSFLFTIRSLCNETQVRRSVVGSALGSTRWLSLVSRSE